MNDASYLNESKRTYFNDIKQSLLTESAITDFNLLNEEWYDYLNPIEWLKNIGTGISGGIDELQQWLVTGEGGKVIAAKDRGILTNALNSALDYLKDPQVLLGGGAVIAGLYLIKKFMSKKKNNDITGIDAETIKRVYALSQLSNLEAQKQIQIMKKGIA